MSSLVRSACFNSVAAIAFAMTCATAAQAQVAEVDTIVVTAQKREQSLLDVPISVTAMTGEKLEAMGADQFADYAASVPGLGFSSVGTFGNRGSRQINLRGISSNVGSATVGFYINETPLRFVDPRVIDLERIEVLRGPQGTLYGAGAMGGAIRVITAKPNLVDFSGKVAGTLSYTENGETNYSLNGMVNLPLVEGRAALRVTGFYDADGGYIDNEPTEALPLPATQVSTSAAQLVGNAQNYNDETISGYRVALTLEPTDSLTITPSVYHQRHESDAWSAYIAEVGDLKSNFLEMSPHSEDFTLYDLTLNYDFGGAVLTSSTSFTDFSLLTTEPFERVLTAFFGAPYVAPYRSNIDQEVFVQEVRLASSGDGPLTWLVGAFYQKDDQTTRQRFVAPDINADLFGGFPVVTNGELFVFDADREETQKAVFGEATYALSPKVDVTLGLRWFDVESTRVGVADGLFNGGQTLTDVTSHESGWTPKAEISFHPADDTLIYASVSKGFRPGFGFVVPPSPLCDADLTALGISSVSGQVESDSLWSYETGAKTRVMDGRLTLAGSVYYNRWTNLQQSVELPTCGFVFSANAGAAESRGFELEATFRPIDALVVDLAVGYVNAELTEAAPGVAGAEGDRLLFVPDWNVAVGVTYRHPVGETDMTAFYHADYQYTGDMNFTFAPLPADLHSRDGYSIAGARVGLETPGWTAAAFVENLFDERPTVGNLRFATSGLLINTRRPRTVGISLTKTF